MVLIKSLILNSKFKSLNLNVNPSLGPAIYRASIASRGKTSRRRCYRPGVTTLTSSSSSLHSTRSSCCVSSKTSNLSFCSASFIAIYRNFIVTTGVGTAGARVSFRPRNIFPHFCMLFFKLPLFVVMLPIYRVGQKNRTVFQT